METGVERCDECLEQDVLYDAVLNCKAVRLCRRCLDNTEAIEIPKAKFSQIPKIAPPSTKEVLFRMSGLNAREWEAKESARQRAISEINMDYMRARKKEREKAMLAEAEKARIAAITAQKLVEIQQAQQQQMQEEQRKATKIKVERKSFFNFFRKKTAKTG